MRFNIAFMEATADAGGGGDPGTEKVPDVTIDPVEGYMPINVFMSTTDTAAHIFYTLGFPPTQPAHDGDNALPGTTRIGSYQGSINVNGGPIKVLRALAYRPGYLDSNISEGSYEVNTGQ